MKCAYRNAPLPASSRRDRQYCTNNCSALASYYRRKAGRLPPPKWRHPALDSQIPLVRAAANHAEGLGESHGWSPSTIMCVMDGLTLVLDGYQIGQRVALTEIRAQTSRQTSSVRVAEVLSDLDLLDDDTPLAIRSWIERRTSELPVGFAGDVRAWLLVLLDGDTRSRPRSHAALYTYFGALRPLLRNWALTRAHLREITTADITAALDPLRRWPRRTTIAALRSLFRFVRKQGRVFTDPTTRLKSAHIERGLLPMTDAEIRAVEQVAATPTQRLVVALAAVHAARATAIRHLTLDDLDLPNRRITIAGHPRRLGELTHQALLAWFTQRRTSWPYTPNQHVLINTRTALGVEPVGIDYLKRHLLRRGIYLEHIRGDRVLHEALSVGADPLHLALVFNLSHTTASRYAVIAQDILDAQLEQTDAEQ